MGVRMKWKLLMLLCISASLNCNMEKRVRVTQGICKGNEGYVAGTMTLNLNLEVDDLLNVLLGGIHPDHECTDQLCNEIKRVVEIHKQTKSPKLAFSFVCDKENKCFGVFDVDSLETIK